MNNIQKIYPSADELRTINTNIHCPIDGCQSVFSSESNLTLHVTKTHKRASLARAEVVSREFYCPDPQCMYRESRFFKSFKLLKQHFMKVHGEKLFVCDSCGKGFPMKSAKDSHIEYCGVSFKCSDCGVQYTSYETLLTHGRRKEHKVLEKKSFKVSQPQSEAIKSASSVSINPIKERRILPKYSTSVQMVPIRAIVTSEKGSQTDVCRDIPKLKSKHTQVTKDKPLVQKRLSKQSQTSEFKRTWLSTETQTIGDYEVKKPKLAADDRLNKTINTQTAPVDSKTQSCNTSFEMVESDYSTRNSSATQTILPPSVYSTSTSTHDFIHTDTSELDSLLDSSNFFNFDIETQTDYIFDDNLLSDYNRDCYSDIQTQTTFDFQDAMLDSTDILFSTIHTQTLLAKSVESQTVMSSNKMLFSCRDMAHMETQTDVDFKMLLEEINA